jgi:hypothetical protein
MFGQNVSLLKFIDDVNEASVIPLLRKEQSVTVPLLVLAQTTAAVLSNIFRYRAARVRPQQRHVFR